MRVFAVGDADYTSIYAAIGSLQSGNNAVANRLPSKPATPLRIAKKLTDKQVAFREPTVRDAWLRQVRHPNVYEKEQA